MDDMVIVIAVARVIALTTTMVVAKMLGSRGGVDKKKHKFLIHKNIENINF